MEEGSEVQRENKKGRIKSSGGFSFKWKSKLGENEEVRKGRVGRWWSEGTF